MKTHLVLALNGDWIKKGVIPMANENDIRKNGSGYIDPTAYKAIKNLERDQERFQKLLDTIFNICELSGFHIEERIVIKDMKTGKVWR